MLTNLDPPSTRIEKTTSKCESHISLSRSLNVSVLMSFTSFYGPQALSLLLTSVARRSWAVPLCRLQSLLSSNSKLLALCRLASALSQLLLAVNRSVDSDGITLNSVVECCPPFVGSTTLSSPVSPLKQLQTTSPLAELQLPCLSYC